MNPELSDIKSIINGWTNAKDSERVFTYIEFTKMFGYDNAVQTFITSYKDYVTQWAKIKKQSITLNDDDFILSKMVDILKAITLDYSSYEEQDFIAHINLSNKSHLKALTALYSRKIREITEFYRKKRNESVLVVRRNSMKGSTKSIQEIIYEKVFDFIFSNKNIVPSYKDIKRDLLVSVENYVDTYSEYFDIPRIKEFTDESRAEMLSANMNDVDYRMYLEIELVVSEILFSGNVMLEEIPLIAQLGVDLSASCVGDMLALKNTMVANTTINQVDLNEQIALKRRLYEKFLGCDLYYLYVDLQGEVTMDVLCRANNPTGNLLNCGTPDTATIQSDSLELLSHIGLFFKPDKTSILKVNAKDYTWTVDTDKLVEDTVYIFPDPNKYGDIGNNKSDSYPLIMEYKLDWDIKNLSSGQAANDPMLWITDQGWASYYSKQDDDFKVINNVNYEYAFTWLANQGYLHTYQTDAWGNQFGLLKGCNVTYKIDEYGQVIKDNEGNPVIDKITMVNKYNSTEMQYGSNEPTTPEPLLLNGGYMENPFYDGNFGVKKHESGGYAIIDGSDKYTFYRDKKVPFLAIWDETLKSYRKALPSDDTTNTKTCYIRSIRFNVSQSEVAKAGDDWREYYVPYNKTSTIWVYKGIEENTRPFNFDQKLTMTDTYNWSGLTVVMPPQIYLSEYNNNFINYGTFGSSNGIQYEDHFRVVDENKRGLEEEDNVIIDVLTPFLSINLLDKSNEKFNDIKFEAVDSSYEAMQVAEGELFVKLSNAIDSKPMKFKDAFTWLDYYITTDDGEQVLLLDYLVNGKIQTFSIMYNNIIIETPNHIIFIPYGYDGSKITDNLGIKELYKIQKKDCLATEMIFNEDDQAFYIIQLKSIKSNEGNIKRLLIPNLYKFEPRTYSLVEQFSVYDCAYKEKYEENNLDKQLTFSGYVSTKKDIIGDGQLYINEILNEESKWKKFEDFEIPYFDNDVNLGKVAFTYNSSLGTYLISYIIDDMNGTPYIFEHKFKITDIQTFHDSLVTNLYTIKGVTNDQGDVISVNYRYNSDIQATEYSSMPTLDEENTRIFIEL